MEETQNRSKLCLLTNLQIQASNGEVTITNDGATILKQMNVTHPAAKMVISLNYSSIIDLTCFVSN